MRVVSYQIRKVILTILLSSILLSNCQSHSNQLIIMKEPDTLQNRQPAVAGQFYPSEPGELKQMLESCFASAPKPIAGTEVMAVISPHAGYIFSGEVAAAAFNQVDKGKKYKTIFILGSSHRHSFPGASVYSVGKYITPLGAVATDFEIAEKLVSENKVLSFDPQYHKGEHSIEVQIPFLQYVLKNEYKIVPILLGTQDAGTCEKIAKALSPYFTSENLFVISTDFSHYPAYNEAVKTDKTISDAIAANNPERFLQAIEICTKKNISGLVTCCCSWPSVITLMYLTENKPGIAYKQVMYKNSGDSKQGEKDRVVGYLAISVSQQDQNAEMLSAAEQSELLQLARTTIAAYLKDKSIPEVDVNALSPGLTGKAGAFVTLKKAGALRGCIGHFEADNPLYKIVQQMAVASSTQDYRFETISVSELKQIDIEISVLSPMRKISDVNDIRLGTDGVFIKKGNRSGTFLPQVAAETGWKLEEFLGHCARDKAGIGWEGWKENDAEIFVYQAFVFSEKE